MPGQWVNGLLLYIFNCSVAVLLVVLFTGALLRAGNHARAAEIFALAELVFTRFLQRQILDKSLSLDTFPDTLGLMQNVILTSAKSFLETDDKLVADTIIRWKCVFAELRALLMQCGMGAKFLETARAIREVQVGREVSPSEVEDRLAQIARQHEGDVHQVTCTKGTSLLVALLEQKHKDVQSLLRPGQLVLDYCACLDEYSHLKLPIDENESDGLLLVLQATEAPRVKRIDLNIAAAFARKWIMAVPKYSHEEATILTREMCNLLIPAELQAVLASGAVEQVVFCPHPTFATVPLEVLPLPGGQLLGERCSLVYLSAARELLRKSTLTTALGSSEIEERKASVKEGDDAAQPPDVEHPTETGAAPVAPSAKQCLIFADPNFDLELRTPECDPGVVQALVASMSALLLKPSQPPTNLVPRLPKTRDEAHEIERNLSTAKNPLSVKTVLGDEVTLASVLAVEAPFVLHFSTHGFSGLSVRGVPCNYWDDTKCGLLLAGANTHRQGDMSKVASVAGTGELTALAVMGMNLDGTRLVYLSMCQSTQGIIPSGEAVTNLAQAFRVAGAKTVVATLWSELDDEARMFAVHFYLAACSTGIRPSRALALAKQKMLALGYAWTNWTSFHCVGEDVPLFSPTD